MAGLNVSKWQASRRKAFYDPALQFYLRLIRTAFDDAMAVKGASYPYSGGLAGSGSMERQILHLWDKAIMARDWIARHTPNEHKDREGYLLSFQHCCEVLGLDADHEATWMLAKIDAAADFDTDEIHARIAYLAENPPDEVEEELFASFRTVPALDQGSLFAMTEAA